MNKIAVLIVDDCKEDRYLLKRELHDTGLDVKVFEKADGEDALKYFENYEENRKIHPEEFPPLVIFLDVNMPKVDGFTFLERYADLKKRFQLDTCVVIMFSSSERPKDRAKALSYDFVEGYLTKGTIMGDELANTIKKIATR